MTTKPEGYESQIRVLIADDESLIATRLAEFLTQKGFFVRTVRNGKDAYHEIEHWGPDLVLYDLMLPELNALQFLKNPTTAKALVEHKSKFIVMSGHNDVRNVRECLRAGAIDYIRKPYTHSDLLGRLVILMRARADVGDYRAEVVADNNNAQYYLHLTELTLRESLKGAPLDQTLFNLAGMVGMSFNAVRTSIVKRGPEDKMGIVVTSSDKRDIGKLEIELRKYPEILHVVSSDRLLAIDNLGADTTMQFVTRLTKSISFNSIIVAPIRLGGHVWGVISMRMPDTRNKRFSEFEIRFAQLAAHVIGLALARDPANLVVSEGDGFSRKTG